MTKAKHNIIIPASLNPRPQPHEQSAAFILSAHFRSHVHFLEKTSRSTPDISINGIEWELKSPIGNSKNNIQKNMREACHQSTNIIIDLRRSKLHQARAIGYVRQFLLKYNKPTRLLIITKNKKVLAIK